MRSVRSSLCWLAVNVCRFALALTFVFSGTVKLIDPRGFQYKLEDYAGALGLSALLPMSLPLVLAVVVAMAEFIIGINLFFGIRRRLTSVASLVFMLVVTPLTLYVALTGAVADCGCFGDALVLGNWQTFWKNVILLAASVVAVCRPREMTRFISERNQWTISIYSVAFSLALALYCVYRLPVIDFRPYHVGVDLPRAIEEEWTGNAAEPKYADFSIDTPDGDDITISWLEQAGYKFLLVAPYLETADDGAVDDINNIHEYCVKEGYPFLCLTSSAADAIERWQDMTGAEYDFAFTDGTVLKTVIRSNPGLLLLNGGVIVKKWPNSALPDASSLTAPIEELKAGEPQHGGYLRGSLLLLLWFFVPLLVFALADRVWAGGKYLKSLRKQSINQQTNVGT